MTPSRLLPIADVRSLPPNLSAAAVFTPAKAVGFSFVKTVGAVSEYRLECNGLQVLLLPEHSSPTLTFMITYRVGSRNEAAGTTGATHLLEHLMFKGTPKFNRAHGTGLDQLLERIGGIYNATTSRDRTNYFANISSENLDEYMAGESDRMRNLWLRESDRKLEMTVVRNEFEIGENNPAKVLAKEIFATAYVAHPYHHPTIGWRSDIENVSIEKLQEFYRTFYWPNNATALVVGDFAPDKVLELVKKHYGAIPKAPKPIPSVYTVEPEQTGVRRVTMKRTGKLGVVGVAHKTPSALHPDQAALQVLNVILTAGKNSRCYRALTDKNHTTGVRGNVGFFQDPSLSIIYADLAPEGRHEQIEKIVIEELERVKKGGVMKGEVDSAIAQIAASSAYARDGSPAIANRLNDYVAAGDWSLYVSEEAALRKVTAADVKRVSNAYFQEDKRTIGWFVPDVVSASPAGLRKSKRCHASVDASRHSSSMKAACRSRITTARPVNAAASESVSRKVVRAKIAGIDLVGCPTEVAKVVTFRGSLPAGNGLAPPANRALPVLVGAMLDKGTLRQDKFAIAQKLDDIGAMLSFSVGGVMMEFRGKCIRKDLSTVLCLLAEQLRTPAFTEEEFAKVKRQLAGNLQRALESPDVRALQAFSETIFPIGHPNYSPPTLDIITAIESADLAEVKAFHAAYYGAAQATLVAVGDIDVEALKANVSKAFAGWGGGRPRPQFGKATHPTERREKTINMADKPGVSVIIGQATGLKCSDQDRLALRVATSALGSGFTGRLMANIRDKEGLTYGIYAGLESDTFADGAWQITTNFAANLLEKGIASALRQLDEWYSDGLMLGELERVKSNLIGRFKVSLGTTDGLAQTLIDAVHSGYDVTWLDEYPKRLNDLKLPEVNRTIKRHLHPETMAVIKVGGITRMTDN